MTQGLFVSFEGIDGSGKSTQARRLAASLTALGFDCVLTREPGAARGRRDPRTGATGGSGSVVGRNRAAAVHSRPPGPSGTHDPPALALGKIVICDRFADSTRMYQGLSRGDLRKSVDQLHDLMIGTEPDVTILVDMDPEAGLRRAKARNTAEERFEDFGLDLQEKMRAGFCLWHRSIPTGFGWIDGNRSEETVAQDVLAVLQGYLNKAAS